MWDLTRFSDASEESTLKDILEHDVSEFYDRDSRMFNFADLSKLRGLPCLPYRDFSLALNFQMLFNHICEEKRVFVAESPLVGPSGNKLVSIDVCNKDEVRYATEEDIWAGGFMIFNPSFSWFWLSQYSDFGYLYADLKLIEKFAGTAALTAYCTHSAHFRAALGADDSLDREIQKLDILWSKYLCRQ